MSIIPEIVTPEELANRLGWPPRRVRKIARQLGACLVSGNSMVLTEADVHRIMESQRCPSSYTSAMASGITGEQLGRMSVERAFEAHAKPKTKASRRVRFQKSRPATGKVISMVREQS